MQSHVPKFGNWDGDNVPYTAYFENARKEKAGGVKINPNDPEQNPEAFNIGGASNGISPDNEPPPRRFGSQKTTHDQQKGDRGRTWSLGSSSNDKSPSDSSVNPVLKAKPKKSNQSRSTSTDDFPYKSVSVPKFGQWDENDPRSAEGFTMIFNKVKEEKQISSAKFPSVPVQSTQNYEGRQDKESRKKCCCLF